MCHNWLASGFLCSWPNWSCVVSCLSFSMFFFSMDTSLDFSGRTKFFVQPKTKLQSQSNSKSQDAFPTNGEIRTGTRVMDHPSVSRLVLLFDGGEFDSLRQGCSFIECGNQR